MSALSSSSNRVSISNLLLEIKQLTPIQQRCVAACVGSSVGDAATRPFHWLYDRVKLESIVKDEDPAFWPTSESPFYTLETGRRSCYNDICVCMLRSLTPHYSKSGFVKSIVDLFAPPSEYSTSYEIRQQQAAYDPAKRTAERQPIPGPWQQASITKFLANVPSANFDGNPEVKETDGLMACIPLIARLVVEGVDVTKSKVISDAAELLSSNLFCIRHTYAAASILQEAILRGNTMDIEKIISLVPKEDEIDQQIADELQSVRNAINNNTPYSDAVEAWGKQCANPGNFKGSVLAIVTSTNFRDGIRKSIMAGGCNCSRSNFIGCVLGAIYGFNEDSGITTEWLEKTDKAAEILRLSIDLSKA